MTCAESRRLMHLDRPGERTDRETRAWLEHLKGCPACAAEAGSAAGLRDIEQRLRVTEAPMPDLTFLRTRILTATTNPQDRRAFETSRPRLAYAFALAVALIWFGTDQWRIRTAHAELHQQAGRTSSAAVGPQIVYTVDPEATRQLTAHGAVIPSALTAEGGMEVAQTTALRWLESTPSQLVRTVARTPAQRAQITEALKILRSAVDVSIRYRSQGA